MDVILLNGASGSGKSSIAAELQNILSDNYIHIGIDTFIRMMPPKSNDLTGETITDGFYWQKVNLPDQSSGFRIKSGTYGQKVNIAYRASISSFILNDVKVIVDDITDGEQEMELWKIALAGYSVFYVGVHCELKVLEYREKCRGDRKLGSAKEQFYRVHKDIKYDLLIDTSNKTPKKCALEISSYLIEQS